MYDNPQCFKYVSIFFQRPKYFQGLLLVAFDSHVAVLCIAFAFRKLPRLRFSKGIISVISKSFKVYDNPQCFKYVSIFFSGQNTSRAYYWLHSTVRSLFYVLHSLLGNETAAVAFCKGCNISFQKVIKCPIIRNVSSKFRFFQHPKHFQVLL